MLLYTLTGHDGGIVRRRRLLVHHRTYHSNALSRGYSRSLVGCLQIDLHEFFGEDDLSLIDALHFGAGVLIRRLCGQCWS